MPGMWLLCSCCCLLQFIIFIPNIGDILPSAGSIDWSQASKAWWWSCYGWVEQGNHVGWVQDIPVCCWIHPDIILLYLCTASQYCSLIPTLTSLVCQKQTMRERLRTGWKTIYNYCFHLSMDRLAGFTLSQWPGAKNIEIIERGGCVMNEILS